MTWQKAIREGQRLHEVWIGRPPVDLKRVQAVIRQDIAATKLNPGRMTAGCLANCRNDLKIVGSIIRHHPGLFKEPAL